MFTLVSSYETETVLSFHLNFACLSLVWVLQLEVLYI